MDEDLGCTDLPCTDFWVLSVSVSLLHFSALHSQAALASLTSAPWSPSPIACRFSRQRLRRWLFSLLGFTARAAWYPASENHCFVYFSSVLVVQVGRVIYLVLVTPSWSDAEVQSWNVKWVNQIYCVSIPKFDEFA